MKRLLTLILFTFLLAEGNAQNDDYFRVYNRWGQMVFETTMSGKGWDGRVAGKEQATSTYVWIVKGTDYTGKMVVEKGTVTLIR